MGKLEEGVCVTSPPPPGQHGDSVDSSSSSPNRVREGSGTKKGGSTKKGESTLVYCVLCSDVRGQGEHGRTPSPHVAPV